MGTLRGLTPADRHALAFLLAEARRADQLMPHRTRALGIQILENLIEPSTAPLAFRLGPKGWMIGIGEGERLAPPSDAVGEGLRVLHAAVSDPLDPCLIPRVNLGAARQRVTRARQFIRDRCEALADLLEDVTVNAGDNGAPVATYAPQPGAPKVWL
jgi:hypothetical protein